MEQSKLSTVTTGEEEEKESSRHEETKPRNDGWKPDDYSKATSYLHIFADSLFELLHPVSGERILDLGCGTGELTFGLQQRGCEVVGIDSSPAMIEKARERGVDGRVIDAHDLSFTEEFDAVFTNAALHWMKKNPSLVVQNVVRCLKPGGRFAGEFAGEGSSDRIVNALTTVCKKHGTEFPNLWCFHSRDDFVKLLESNGLRIDEAIVCKRLVAWPSGPAAIFKVFEKVLFEGYSESERQQFIDEVITEMEPLQVNEEGVFAIDLNVIRFHATKEVKTQQ